MKESIKLSHTIDGHTQSVRLCSEAVKLDEDLWAWLQSAFVGIGFDADNVRQFFKDRRNENKTIVR